MHVLALPKWYPGRNDPQLGDFIRKQMMATSDVLREQGGRVSVVFPIQLEGLTAGFEQELTVTNDFWELRCYYRPFASAIGPLRKLVNLFRWWRACREGVERAIQERGLPDLTHVHILVRPALMARWLKRKHGVPYILSEQSSEYLDGTYTRRSGLFKWWSRRVFGGASSVSAVSRHLADAIVSHKLREEVTVIGNVIPGIERPLPERGEAHRFMLVADLVDKTKNVSGVLRAINQCRAEGVPVELDVVGGGEDMEALKRQASSLGLNGSVRWHGRVSQPEVLDRMAHTGSVIINSNVETFSVVTGEALAMGKPVIATRCGGPQAFIQANNGVLIEPKNDEQLAEAMGAMVRNHQLYDPAAIRRTITERFSPRSLGEQFRSLYQRVLNGK